MIILRHKWLQGLTQQNQNSDHAEKKSVTQPLEIYGRI